jgi:hypothetical protein
MIVFPGRKNDFHLPEGGSRANIKEANAIDVKL